MNHQDLSSCAHEIDTYLEAIADKDPRFVAIQAALMQDINARHTQLIDTHELTPDEETAMIQVLEEVCVTVKERMEELLA